MTSHELLKTAIKLTGLFLVIDGGIDAAASLPLMAAFSAQDPVYAQLNSQALYFIVAAALPILIGVIFWLMPSAIASTVITLQNTTSDTHSLLDGIEKIAIRILALFLFYNGVVELFETYLMYRQDIISGVDAKNFNYTFVIIALKITLAIGLFLGSTGIRTLIRKLRYSY